jgi:DNA-binding transcriptional regulator YhcF (GntR family)
VSGKIGYRQAAEVIGNKITSGELSGTLTIGEVQRLTGATYATARTAAEYLEREEILTGQQGRGFEIVATPAEAAAKRVSIEKLSEQVAALQQEVAELRKRVGRMAATLATMAKKPRGGKRNQVEVSAGDEQ